MKNYDDVRQFINKVGEQNLNYRSFQANTPSSGLSKWHLINQVKNYKPSFSNPLPERIAPFNGATGHSGFENHVLMQSLSQRSQSVQLAACPEQQCTEPASDFYAERHAAFQSVQQAEASNPFRRQKPDSETAHRHKKSQQQSQADVQATKTDSLAALFYRIAL